MTKEKTKHVVAANGNLIEEKNVEEINKAYRLVIAVMSENCIAPNMAMEACMSFICQTLTRKIFLVEGKNSDTEESLERIFDGMRHLRSYMIEQDKLKKKAMASAPK